MKTDTDLDFSEAVLRLQALAQETRLKAFRIISDAGVEGIAAGELGRQLSVPCNALSFHLNHLKAASLIQSKLSGRYVIYSANRDAIRKLLRYLSESCTE